jgi:hypothetical protein
VLGEDTRFSIDMIFFGSPQTNNLGIVRIFWHRQSIASPIKTTATGEASDYREKQDQPDRTSIRVTLIGNASY